MTSTFFRAPSRGLCPKNFFSVPCRFCLFDELVFSGFRSGYHKKSYVQPCGRPNLTCSRGITWYRRLWGGALVAGQHHAHARAHAHAHAHAAHATTSESHSSCSTREQLRQRLQIHVQQKTLSEEPSTTWQLRINCIMCYLTMHWQPLQLQAHFPLLPLRLLLE